MDQQRDLQRNTACVLGALGTALGVLGGVMSGLGIVAWLMPGFALTAPDWFFTLVVIALLVMIVGAWPALDWLLNSRPSVGGQVLAILGMALIAEGLVAVICTSWRFTGWVAIVGARSCCRPRNWPWPAAEPSR